MKKYEFHSSLFPEEFLDDLREWTPIVNIACKIDRNKRRVKLWSKHTEFGRGHKPLTIFQGYVHPAENGSVLRGSYRPVISAPIGFIIIPLIWSILLRSRDGVILFSLWWLAMCVLELWDNASERNRMIRMLLERYP